MKEQSKKKWGRLRETEKGMGRKTMVHSYDKIALYITNIIDKLTNCFCSTFVSRFGEKCLLHAKM